MKRMATITTKLLFSSLVTLFLYNSIKGDSCELGWQSFGDNCYKIRTVKLNKLLAETSCYIDGSTLASIPDLETLQFLSREVVLTNIDSFWVGLRYINGRGIWFNNETMRGQPWVHLPQTSPDRRTCFIFNGAKVIPHNCSERESFICEMKKIPSHNVTCPEGTVAALRNEKCIWLSHHSLPHRQAMEECKNAGGTGVNYEEIKSEGISNVFQPNIIRNLSGTYWITNTNANSLSLPDALSEGSFNDASDEGKCETIKIMNQTFSSNTFLLVENTNCDQNAFAICWGEINSINITVIHDQLAPTSENLKYECPHGYNWKEDKLTGLCYWETSYETDRLSWEDARKYCQSYGGDLASLHSIEEEKIGLSFQYGSLAHPYWIGLKHDLKTNSYVWSDGSPLDYENWAPGQPNNKDLRMQCVHMDAATKSWAVSFCGILSWFICKAPKQLKPKIPVLPTPEPLLPCTKESVDSYYFNGYCYESVPLHYNWHRAQIYCENKGSNLASVHSVEEVSFLLRLLYANKALNGNRVWIGLNSLGLDGSYKWSDGTILDFIHWNEDEPNNFQNQEKCCNMYTGNGLWNDQNCNAVMGFVCKRRNDTKEEPLISTTTSPLTGNCKKGWYAFRDRCYLPVGAKKSEWMNWVQASLSCHYHGGYLASIRDAKEQAFLSYLMQNLKSNTWIGLHDTIHSGVYFWMDNSPMHYANWAPGEPSFFGLQEDCVLMVYDSPDSGIWKDETCATRLPYICQLEKDSSIETPWIPRSMSCIHPYGWLKQGYSCYKLYNTPLTFQEAEATCAKQGSHIVSISDFTVQAVVKYLATNISEPFWIGLQVNDNKFTWINGQQMTLSKWEKNEPATMKQTETCIISSPYGYWRSSSCSEKHPFLCQASTGKAPVPEKILGTCPLSSYLWIDIGTNYCYMLETQWSTEWYTANFRCFVQGGQLISIHSLEEMQKIKKYIKSGISSLYIGLTKNLKGGFIWSDGTPVDFVNWDQGEPEENESEDQCVEMSADTLKWRVISCNSRRHSICSVKKESTSEANTTSITADKLNSMQNNQDNRLPGGAVAAIVIVCLLVAVIVSMTIYCYYHPPLGKSRFGLRRLQQATSFENALFNEDSTMEFNNDRNSVTIRD